MSKFYDINIDHDWWDSTYEDAERIGLKIKSFDLHGNRHADGLFIDCARACAMKILKEHGETCETYADAKAFLLSFDAFCNAAPKNDYGEFESLEDARKADEMEKEFLQTILEDYSIMLQKEYEYLTSAEAIEETIEANDYEFTEDGRLA